MNVKFEDLNSKKAPDEEQEIGVYRWLVDLYDQTQKTRIAMQNRSHALERTHRSAGPHSEFMDFTIVQLRAMERSIERQIKKEIKNHPLWPWLSKVDGVGALLGAKLIGMIDDVERFSTVSKLWRYAGLAVNNGKAERRRAGVRIHYNPYLKTTMYLVGTAIMRRRGAYKRFYDEAKVYYQDNRPDWDAGHIHIASMRKMEKVFLSDLWEAWRNVLSTDAPSI